MAAQDDVIKCPVCNEQIKISDLPSHLQEVHPDLPHADALQILQSHFPPVTEITKDMGDGKLISMEVQILGVKAWTYPPLDFTKVMEMDQTEDKTIPNPEKYTKIAGYEVNFGSGYIIILHFKNIHDALDQLNDIVSKFNIMGIPIDYFNDPKWMSLPTLFHLTGNF